MGLTVTEKEHWKGRIERRIDQAIQTLCAKNDPRFLARVKEDARNRAIESLELAEFEKRIVEITLQKEALVREENHTYRKMIAALKRCDARDVCDRQWARVDSVYRPHDVQEAIELRREVHERELLGETPMGRRILQLREEKEELLDTVWLATSGKQIKELWQKVSELLDQEPTPLQAKALLIDPADEEPV